VIIMPATTIEWRKEASVEELNTRAAEMRGEWATLAAGDRESDTYRAAKTEFLNEVEDIDVNLTLRGMEQMPAALRGRTQGGDNGVLGGTETRSAGEIVTQDPDFLAWCKRSAGKTGIGDSPGVELRALVSEGDANGSSTLLPVGQPYLVDTRRRRLFIRDLIGVQQTGLAAIPYVRELNTVANALTASTVAEGATKPEATIQFVPDLAPVQVIAATIPITTQILEDAVTLVGYINGRLVYMLKLREEDEILRGNGVTPDLKGIMNFAGVQTQATAGAGEYAITLGNAIAKIELVDGFADGIAMNPATYWSMVTHRWSADGTHNTGGFDAGMFSQTPVQYVWGLPVVRSNSLNANQNLVGNYAMGATLFDRSQSGVRVFEQHGTFAAENKVLLRAEERVALAVNRPDFFVIATTS
jgi:HK97 family phage major capsid protein